jgi:hypothetical protein
MKKPIPIEIQKKNEFALCSIMFFAPLIHYHLKKNNYWLLEQDKLFIMWYVKYWYIVISILLLNIVLSVYNLWPTLTSIFFAIDIINILLVLLVTIWIFLIFSNTHVLQKNTAILDLKKIKSWNLNILLEYLPISNYYFRYNKEKDIKSYWWLKESIIFTSAFVVTNLFVNNLFLIIFFIVFYIIRIATLFGGIDFISDSFKEKLDIVFHKNPEEIYWYIKGIILFSIEKVVNNWDVSDERKAYLISQSKWEYSWLNNINNLDLLIEYSIYILILLLFFILFKVSDKVSSNISWWFYLISWVILISRYLVMLPQKKLPYIPIIHDLYVLIKNILIKNKLLKNNK